MTDDNVGNSPGTISDPNHFKHAIDYLHFELDDKYVDDMAVLSVSYDTDY